MTTQINQDNIQPSTLAELGSGPTVTNIQITNSSYVVLDDTAVSTSGGYIKITGTNFASGCEVIIGSTNATAVAFVSSTVLNVQVPALSAGTYVVYVVNSDGSVAIRVNGLTYSGTPTWVTGSTLTSGAVNVAISIQLSATGDAPLTYTLASGSSLPSGLTLTSGGLLSGTVTGISVETIYNFTIDVTDAQSQESPRSFSITISVSDQYFPYVSSLLSATALTLPFNNDASTNNFAVTVVGDTRPNNFGPYTPGYYSNYFDGTGDYLTTSGANLQIGTNQFTLEAWIYPTAQNTYDGYVSSAGDGGAYTGISMSYDQCWIGSSSVVVSYAWSASIVLNKWNHIAITRDGSNTVRWFVNGTLLSTSTNITTNINSTNYAVGLRYPNYLGYYPTGYISNVRLIVGSAAYTASFSVPTTPFTAASGTQLLTCQSNRFIDNSTNNFTITRNGDTLVSGFDPFTPSSSYSTYGSGYFDGTGDYLAPTTNSAFAFGTGDLTFECWIYATTANDSPIYESRSTNSTTDGFTITAFSSTVIRVYTTAVLVSATVSNYVNTWAHVAFTRQGSTNRLFVNGVLGATATAADNFSNTTAFIGAGRYASSSLSAYFTGYISDVRVVKGTAVYTSAFTPPTTPLTAVSGTSLLTCQTNQPNNNNAFLDSSTNNFLVTRNGNTTQGSFSPYGPLWSNYFDGTGDYLGVTSNNAAFGLGTGDFTIECWVYATSNPANGPGTIFDLRTTVNASATAGRVNSSRQVMFYDGPANVETAFTNILLNLNNWSHIAWVRSGNTVTCYINGAVAGSVTVSSNLGTSQPCYIGTNQSPGYNWYGYVSNFRIVKGTAVYTSAFTPSTSPLTAIANTSLLTCTDNRFIDESPNNFAITRAGDVSVQRFSPFSPQTVPTYYSGYFDGTGDYLTTPSSNEFIASGNGFTVEAWVYYTAISDFSFIVASTTGANNYNPYWFIGSTSGGNWRISWGDATAVDVGVAITLNTWNHVAISMGSNGTGTFYVNGVSRATTTGKTLNGSATGVAIAHGGGTLAGQYLVTGYISNVRYVKNNSVYTSAFTPPTSPLTAIANTSLLTCQSATFIDNSTNNFTITVNGNSTPTTVSPFTPTATTGVAYSPSVYGGSMYFDGSGDYLTVASNTAFSLTTDFTVEFWVYTGVNGVQGIISTGNGLTVQPYFYINGLVPTFLYNGVNVATGPSIILNAWNHIAYSRSSSSIRVFTNGVAGSTASPYTDQFTNSGIWISGSNSGTQLYTGYISNVRIVKGTAVYTSNFAPPVSPLTAIQNNVLLLNGTSAGVYDMSMMNDYETVGNTSLVTNIEKYGNSSLYFDGTGDYLLAPASQNIVFGTGNFTIECWLYLTATGVDDGIIIENRSSGASSNGFAFNTRGVAGGYKINFYVGGFNITPNSVTYSSWNHIAVTRSSGTVRIFLNGVIDLTVTINTNLTDSSMTIGQSLLYANSNITGYIDDLRITKGVARYTANFTPTSSPFITS